MSIQQELISFIQNLETIAQGYKSWGKVTVLRIAVREKTGMFVTPTDRALAELKESDILSLDNATGEEEKLLKAIFEKRKGVNCIFITHQEFASALKQEVPPILDDQAQMLGVTVKIAEVSSPGKASGKVISALSGRYAAVCSDGRCICVGNNIDDTYSAVQLLEKTSKAFTEAKYIGGSVSINRLEAWAMKMYFQYKYSREAKTNR